MILSANGKQKVATIDDTKFFVDYATDEQKYSLESIDTFSLNPDGTTKIDNAEWKKYIRLYIRYTIKNWEGLTEEDGTPIKCELVNNELEENLWKRICKLDELVDLLAMEIQKVLRWSPTDKKKFISLDGSSSKVD